MSEHHIQSVSSRPGEGLKGKVGGKSYHFKASWLSTPFLLSLCSPEPTLPVSGYAQHFKSWPVCIIACAIFSPLRRITLSSLAPI